MTIATNTASNSNALSANENIMTDPANNPTRQNLIEAAEQLFWYKGHKATSIDDIAQTSEQSKGAFFHYFKSKKDITLIVLEKYTNEELIAPIDRHFGQYDSHKEGLLSWAAMLYENVNKKKFTCGCLLGNLALEIGTQDDEIREQIAKHFIEVENQMVNHFKQENRRGEILMEPRQFARLVIANYQGLMMSIQLHKNASRTTREFQAFAELFERLIKD